MSFQKTTQFEPIQAMEQGLSLSERFIRRAQATPNFRFIQSACWFHVRLANRNSPENHWPLEAHAR